MSKFWVCTDPTCADSRVIGKTENVSVGEPLLLIWSVMGKPTAVPPSLGKVTNIKPSNLSDLDFSVTVESGEVLWLQESVI